MEKISNKKLKIMIFEDKEDIRLLCKDFLSAKRNEV
jgi:hypothetical protein